MKIKEIAAKKDKELLAELDQVQAKLTKLRFEVAAKESDKTSDVDKMKKDIARIKTILREREIQREEAGNEKNA